MSFEAQLSLDIYIKNNNKKMVVQRVTKRKHEAAGCLWYTYSYLVLPKKYNV